MKSKKNEKKVEKETDSMVVELVNASDVFEDDNLGYIYGLQQIDENGNNGDYVEWFKTEEERQKCIEDNNMKIYEPKNGRESNEEIANRIIDCFEELLASKNIKIPSDDREGNEEEACIYGQEYWNLEEEIAEIISEINQN